MLKRTLRLAACVALLAVFAANLEAKGPAAGNSKADSRVANSLKALKYKYDIAENGTFMVTVPTGEQKSRPVLIDSKTQTKGLSEFRIVMTPVKIYDGELPETVEQIIREANEQLPAGRFVTLDDDGKKIVMFATLVKATATTAELDVALDSAVSIAHTMSFALKN